MPDTEVATEAGSATASATTAAASTTTAPAVFSLDGLPDDLKADKTLAMYDGKPQVEVARGLAEAQKYNVGAVRLPTGKETPEEAEKKFADIYGKLGRPESPEKYDVKLGENLPEGLTVNEELAGAVRGAAHKAGLNSKQLQTLVDTWNAFQIKQLANFNNQRTVAETELKNEWGKDYEPRMAAVQRAVKAMADEKDVAMLEAGLGNNPALVRFMDKFAKHFKEDSAVQGEHGIPADEAKRMNDRIAVIETELRGGKVTKFDSRYKELVDEKDGLFQALYPGVHEGQG